MGSEHLTSLGFLFWGSGVGMLRDRLGWIGSPPIVIPAGGGKQLA